MNDLIVAILDRSGSMSTIRNDAIGGYNTFIEEQRKLGNASVTLVLFDDKYEVVYNEVPIEHVKELTAETFVPRGMTALLDAIGRTIDDVGKKLSIAPKILRPKKVAVCILTDGLENSSKEYTSERIKRMIEHQRSKYSWEFIFLGANMDSFVIGKALGISPLFTQNFVANEEGTREAYASISTLTSSYRTS